MNKYQSASLLMVIVSLAILLVFSCTQPSSPQAGGDETVTTVIDFGHSDMGVISGTIDFSTMIDRDQVKGMAIVVYERERSSYHQRLTTIVSSINNYTAEYKLTGLKAGYEYNPQIYLFDSFIIMGGQNPWEILLSPRWSAYAVAGTDIPLDINIYSTFDGQYQGADRASLSGFLDLSGLDLSLVYEYELSIQGDDGDPSTLYDPYLYFRGKVNNQTRIPFSFVNVDPSYTWKYHECWVNDAHRNQRAGDPHLNTPLTLSGNMVLSDIVLYHSFDTAYKNYSATEKAKLSGTIDTSDLPESVYGISISCDASNGDYSLRYENNNNFETDSPVNYQFINIDPALDHTIRISLYTQVNGDDYKTPYEVNVPNTSLTDGATHIENIALPTTH